MINDIIKSTKRKLWSKVVGFSKQYSWYPALYKSFWVAKFFGSENEINTDTVQYFSSQPNHGAGIGHQIANWIAGFWFAQQFGLKYAYTPFPNIKWDTFLGFYKGEITINELIQNHGYRKIKLPLFNENMPSETSQIANIIKAFQHKKVVFVTEQDQFYRNQFGPREILQHKFHSAKARSNEQLIFSKDYLNIAIHVRRGDITVGQLNKNPNLLMRWQDNDYFKNTLTNVIDYLKTEKPLAIYLFSQGKPEDFQEFEQFKNIHYCLDMGAQESFLHMVYADVLITSKSSFSYKPALLNKNLIVSPKNFWHGYPTSERWLLTDEKGTLLNTQK